MNLHRSCKIVLAALLAAQSFLAAAQTNNAAPLDYSTFSTFIANRNIFDPNRVPNVPWTNAQPRKITPPIARQPDSFSLVGIIGYGEGSQAGTYAFFDGTNPQYRKTTKLNGDIANFKVADIAVDSVTLVSGTNKMVLGIGEQLHDGGGGNWLFSNGTPVRYNTASGYGNRGNSGRNGLNSSGGGRRRNGNYGNGNGTLDNAGTGNFNRSRNNYAPPAAPDNSSAPDLNLPGSIIVIPGGLVPGDDTAPSPDPQNN